MLWMTCCSIGLLVMGGNIGETLVKVLGGAASGYIAGGGAGQGQNLTNIFKGLNWSLDDLFKKDEVSVPATDEGPVYHEGAPSAPLGTINPAEALPPEIAPPRDQLATLKMQPVPAIQVMPGVNVIAESMEEVQPTPQTSFDLFDQPVMRELPTNDGTMMVVTERGFEAIRDQMFSNAMHAMMYPEFTPEGQRELSVEELVMPVEYYEQMDRPVYDIRPDAMQRDSREMDVPRISERLVMNGSFVELGPVLDQVVPEAPVDDADYTPVTLEGGEPVAPVAMPTKAAARKMEVQAQKSNAKLTVDDYGIALLEDFEGRETYVYNDGANFPTIGIGHKLTDEELRTGFIQIGGRMVDWRNGLMDADIDELARQDLGQAMEIVKKYVKVPLNQNQFNALTSFAFNLGPKPFVENAGFLKALNSGDTQDFLRRLQLYTKASGVTMPGLQRRRAAEATLFSAGSGQE